jgi:phosphatidate cytidylyltransferase
MLARTDFYRRLVTSLITVTIVVSLVLFAYFSIFQFVVVGFVAALGGIAVWEYGQFAKAKGGGIILPALITLTVLEVISFFISAKFSGFHSLPIGLYFISFLIVFALHFGRKENAVVNVAVSSFGLLYVAVPVGMILGILYLNGIDGRWWITYLLVVTKITDVGAYFAGSFWGKTKLAPNISPHKTIEGAVAGLACALLASFLFHLGSDYDGRFHLGTFEWVFLGLILGAVGQFGDLSESLLKRDANKKDSNALPGLGGVLDALDSVLFNAPIIYIYLYFIKI